MRESSSSSSLSSDADVVQENIARAIKENENRESARKLAAAKMWTFVAENTRSCVSCNADISGRPMSHTKCYSCFSGRLRSDGSAGSAPHPTTVCLFCDKSGHTVDRCPNRLPHGHPDKLVEKAPCGRSIANVLGSSLDKSSTSWIRDMEEFVGSHTQCMVAACDGKAEEGAHVWVQGDRSSYYIAALCKRCNHRHGEEEICWCRYISKGEEPKQWIPIRNVWLMKVRNKTKDLLFLPFREWCETRPPTHVFRERCNKFCIGGHCNARARGESLLQGSEGGAGNGRKRARSSGSNSNKRWCDDCGIDISDKPEHHSVCLRCYRQDSEYESERRCCDDCGTDISDMPEHHFVCLRCYKRNNR